MLLARAQQRLSQYRSGALPERTADEWRSTTVEAGLTHRYSHTCPACGEVGFLEGEYVTDVQSRYERSGDDDFDVWAELTVATEYFSCETCRLILDSYELLASANMPDDFQETGDMAEYYEPDYGND